MKKRFYRIAGLAMVLTLLAIALPASPVFAATLAISPTSGPPGTSVAVTGSGFGGNVDMAITFDGTEVAWPQSSSSGTISDSFLVPAGKPNGTYALGIVRYDTGVGTIVTISPAINFTVTGSTGSSSSSGTAAIELDPTSGSVGAKINIEGSGFTANDSITAYYDGEAVDLESSADTEADADGYFSAKIAIPGSAAGRHTIRIKDDSSVKADAKFTVKPAIAINPKTGAPKIAVIVTGTGFASDTGITMYFADDDVGISASTDDIGSFTAKFPVPQKEAGDYTIKATDTDDNTATAKDKFKLALQTKADITPDKGGVGTKVNISGIAFKPGSTITVKYDDQSKTTDSDANGAFSMTLIIPESKAGKHTISVTDGTTTKDFTYTVESTPPTAPALQSPPIYAQLQEPAKLIWSKSTDESQPVTYTLQIGTDGNFSAGSVVLEKKGLTDTSYTPTKEEWAKLAPPAPPKGITMIPMNNYYWHVKATDAASNEGSWQSPSLFSVFPVKETPATPAPTPTSKPAETEEKEGGGLLGGIPSWAIYVIAFLIALLFFVIGLLLGRRTAYY